GGERPEEVNLRSQISNSRLHALISNTVAQSQHLAFLPTDALGTSAAWPQLGQWIVIVPLSAATAAAVCGSAASDAGAGSGSAARAAAARGDSADDNCFSSSILG